MTLDRPARSVCDDAVLSVADHQTLRVLEGRYVLERAVSDVEVGLHQQRHRRRSTPMPLS
jgi:hypothetical protein